MKILHSLGAKTLFLLALGVACAALYLSGYNATAPFSLLAADAFTLPATLFLSLYALLSIGKSGFFDGLLYTLSYAARCLLFLPPRGEGLGAYQARKREKAVPRDSLFPLLFAGIILMILAIAFIIVFYSSSTDTTPGI